MNFEFKEVETVEEANLFDNEFWTFVGLKNNAFVFKKRKQKNEVNE